MRVFGEEAIARVNRISTHAIYGMGGGNDRFDREVAVDQHRGIRYLNVLRVTIVLGIDRDRADAHRVQGARDATGNFATIGDQNLREHGNHIRKRPKPGSGSGVAAAISRAMPSTSLVSFGSMIPSSQRRAVE